MSETQRNEAREFIRGTSRTRSSDGASSRESFNDELEGLMAIGHRNDEKLAMDRFLAIRLERDSLPEDTPLPIYLKYREPRKPSPPSVWDTEEPKHEN
ncbi:uncharacterized protein LOC108028227 [Drosophila biarmipes]|uniref:uncharacterized protein LOC108028227 n=1 Tax=Drosophila biarmipes TaxID=125945 RepID=UPI0007E86B55|nr:uncharacterized protein LOC108028227 [Drosophila biarmipes]XP_050742236.1 uncharacterized protein LOC108028227 [Drosophila biarmipes]